MTFDNDMFENLCTLPLASELFAQAIHPTEPIVTVGLSSGHVESYRLPAGANDDDDGASVVSTGTATIDTEWRTRRHKGSCRSLCYSGDGESKWRDSLIAVKILISHSSLLCRHRRPSESRKFTIRKSRRKVRSSS